MSAAAPAPGRVVPTHAEAVPGEPRFVRWIVPAGTFGIAGPVVEAPGQLGLLLEAGSLRSIEIEPGGGSVLVGVAEASAWRRLGRFLQTVLGAALARPGDWRVAPSDSRRSDVDALVRAAAEQVLTGRLGAYVRSHGGALDLVGVRGGVVTVRFRGACTGCPIAGITLHARFERDVRARCPELVGVRAA